MNPELAVAIGYASAIALSAFGSAIGTGLAGLSVIGAGKRCFLQQKPFPFILMAFVGAPLTQTIYGFLLMNAILGIANSAGEGGVGAAGPYFLTGGFGGGLAIGMAAIMQGRAAAAASDALAETGKGFVNFMMILGVIESVALFVMIFIIVILNQLAVA